VFNGRKLAKSRQEEGIKIKIKLCRSSHRGNKINYNMSVGDLFVYSKNKNIKHDSVHTNNNVSSMISKINKKLAQIQLTEINP